jgi:hypothetical protein
MLEFLNPWMLLGIPLASLPFLLHLVRRRPKVTFPWPSLMLVREQTATRRRPTFSELLLLMLRALIILLLVLALALPLWRDDPAAPLTTWLVVDDSWRTSGHLNTVLAAGDDLADALAIGYRLALATTTGSVLIEPTDDPSAWRAGWSKLESTFYAPFWGEALDKVIAKANDSAGGTRIVLVGQPTAEDLPEMGRGFARETEFWQVLPETIPWRGAVTVIEPTPGPILADKLDIVVSGMAPPEAADLTLRIGGAIVARQTIRPTEQTFAVAFHLIRPAGAIRLSAQLGDFPASPQTVRSVYIPPFRQMKVVCWGDYGWAASAALSALPQSPFTTETATSLPADLSSIDLVVNLGADVIPPEEGKRLVAYVQTGGHLLLAGRQTVPEGLPLSISPNLLSGVIVPNPNHQLGRRLAGIPLPAATSAHELLPQGLTRSFLLAGNKAAGVSGTLGSGSFIYLVLGDVASVVDKPGFVALMFEAARWLADPAPLLSHEVGWKSPQGVIYQQPGFRGDGTDTVAISVDLMNYTPVIPDAGRWERAYGEAPQLYAWEDFLDRIKQEHPFSLQMLLLIAVLVLLVGESMLANWLTKRRSS